MKIPPFIKTTSFRDIIIGIGITLLILLPSYYFWHKSKNITPTQSAEFLLEKNGDTISQISRKMRLPDDETPVILTVTDSAKLQTIPFFIKASEGDKILLYPKNGKGILYDPKIDKIINAGPLFIGSDSAQPIRPTSTESAKTTDAQ